MGYLGRIPRSPNFVEPPVGTMRQFLPSFVTGGQGLGTWRQPFLRKNGREAAYRFLESVRGTYAYLAMEHDSGVLLYYILFYIPNGTTYYFTY